MTFSLAWLADVLKNAGLKIAQEEGWQIRGRGEIGPITGVMCHHTATQKSGNMPTLSTLKNGRAGLPGPLAQLGLGRDGTYYVIAAGRCNHAGKGQFNGGVNRGNETFIGIEAENTGQPTDPWPEVQLDAYRRGVAAILRHLGKGVDCCIGHKEYAPGRKPDPSFDMASFRVGVAQILSGTAPAPVLIPPAEPPAKPGDGPGRPTLRRGATGPLVDQLQAKVGVTVDGKFGPKTEAAVRDFQRTHGLVPDGIVGPKTWAKLDSV